MQLIQSHGLEFALQEFLSKGSIESSRGRSVWRQWSPFKPTDAGLHWKQDAKFIPGVWLHWLRGYPNCSFPQLRIMIKCPPQKTRYVGFWNHSTRLTGDWLLKLNCVNPRFQWSETQPCSGQVFRLFIFLLIELRQWMNMVHSSDSYFSNIHQNSCKSTPHTNLHGFQVWLCSLRSNAQAETR